MPKNKEHKTKGNSNWLLNGGWHNDLLYESSLCDNYTCFFLDPITGELVGIDMELKDNNTEDAKK